MGSLRGDNGGESPPNGGGLPNLPPEWGTVVIPDDPAELAKEAGQIRRALRRRNRRNRWRRRLHRPPLTGPVAPDSRMLGLPILVMAIAMVATLVSLFALAWPNTSRHPTTSPPQRPPTTAAPTLPDLTLQDADGTAVHLRNNLPAVFLLADGCACDNLMLATAQAVPAGVTVVAVGHIPPALPSHSPGRRIRAVADPSGMLRAAYANSPPADDVVGILVKGTGEIVRTVRPVAAVTDLPAADLAKLA
jgi:hypothetical protein